MEGGTGLIPQSRNPWCLWVDWQIQRKFLVVGCVLGQEGRSRVRCAARVPLEQLGVGPAGMEWDGCAGGGWSTLCSLVTLHRFCFYFPKGLGSPKNRSTNKTRGRTAAPQSSTLELVVPVRAGADATEMWSWQDAPAGPGGDLLAANILTGSAVGSQSIVPQMLPLTVNGYFGFLSQVGGRGIVGQQEPGSRFVHGKAQ